MVKRFTRWALVPLAVTTVLTTVTAAPSVGITGPNIVKDYEHEYVGLVAFYDENEEFLHRCTGTLLSAEVFLTAGHCVAADDQGNVADTARIWFEQDAGADFNPVTGEPATSGYPVSGGVTSSLLYNYEFTDLSSIPQTYDVGLIVLEPEAIETTYPAIDEFGTLAPVGAANDIGTGVNAVVTVSGYGVTRTNGKNGQNTLSFRERLTGQTFIINTRNQNTAGYNLQLASNFGNGRVGTCFGDSGGPIFAGETSAVVAVNSFVKNWSCGGQGFPYRVDTTDVQDWIKSVLEPLELWDAVAPE